VIITIDENPFLPKKNQPKPNAILVLLKGPGPKEGMALIIFMSSVYLESL